MSAVAAAAVSPAGQLALPASLDEVEVFMGEHSDDNTRWAHPNGEYYDADDMRKFARTANAALVRAADKFLREFDADVANREGENFLVDAGCIQCTCGCVPNHLNTGLCGYHALRAVLARVQP